MVKISAQHRDGRVTIKIKVTLVTELCSSSYFVHIPPSRRRKEGSQAVPLKDTSGVMYTTFAYMPLMKLGHILDAGKVGNCDFALNLQCL